MALRASISVEVLQASVSSAKLTTSVTYELANATGIYVDPDSLNRMIKDEYALSDIRFNLVEKNLSDSYSLPDVDVKDFSKAATDAFSFVESFAKVVSYNRTFTDAFTLDDLSQIDKDFYGNKGNIFAFTDIMGLTYEKALTDDYTVSDVSTLLLYKVAQDSFGISDLPRTTFNKLIEDAFVLDDAAMIDKDFYGNKGNIVGLNEVFVRAVDYQRDLSGNNTSLGNEELNSNLFGATSAPETRVLVQDVSTLSAGKNVNDSVGFNDSNNFNIAKFIYDAFTLDDIALINKDYTSSKGNIFSFSDVMASAVSKAVADTVGFSDTDYWGLTKNYSGDTVSFTETHNKDSGKSLLDSFAFSDIHGVQLSKNVEDTFALDDAALIDKDYFGNKGNVVGLSDLITVNLFMSNQLGTRALNSIQLN